MEVTLLWLKPETWDMVWMESRYQYRHRNTFRSVSGREDRNVLRTRVNSFFASSVSTLCVSTHSSNSSSARMISPPPRFWALRPRQRSMEICRVILARKAFRKLGRRGGMVFHAARYVSLTLSSESSRLDRML